MGRTGVGWGAGEGPRCEGREGEEGAGEQPCDAHRRERSHGWGPSGQGRGQALGREDPLEEDMTTHFSILAWRIPWTEEAGGLRSMGGALLPSRQTQLLKDLVTLMGMSCGLALILLG